MFFKKMSYLFLFVSVLLAQNNYVKVIVPEQDTTISNFSGYRLSASTLPGSKVFINDQEYKVYQSGAFCGLLKLVPGDNNFLIKSISAKGEVAEKKIYIKYKPTEKFLPPSELKIVSVDMPSQDIMLMPGDLLEFKVKATAKCKVLVNDENYLTEVIENGVNTGIYQGYITVKNKFNDVIKIIDTNGKSSEYQLKKKIQILEKPIIGKVKITNPWDRPSIAIGLGTDRLGGQKFQFIVPDIKLVIIGKVGNMYKIKLDNLVGWIDKDYVEIIDDGYLPKSFTGTITVKGGKKYDSLTVPLSTKLPYISYQDPELNRIIVDIYGAIGNTNWITQFQSVKEIKNIFVNQVGEETFRITIDLQHQMNYGYAIKYINNTLVIKIKHHPEKLTLKDKVIVLDAGHGGTDNGALGSTGYKEKDVNLNMVKILKENFEKKGAKVYLAREKDTTMYNTYKLWKIWNLEPDIFISIHSNSIGYTSNPSLTSGVSTYYKHIIFRPLSQYILKKCLELPLNEFGNVGNFNFTNNQPTEFVNTLVELAFMSHPEDEMKLMDEKFLNKMAQKIVEGTENYIKNLR